MGSGRGGLGMVVMGRMVRESNTLYRDFATFTLLKRPFKKRELV